jgi:hypothetical protein
MTRPWALGAAVILLVSGCAPTIESEDEDDLATGCEAWADAYCDRRVACGLDRDSSADACREAFQKGCLVELDRPDVTTDVAALQRCAESLADGDCDDVAFPGPDCPRWSGTRAEGAVCATSAQCRSGSCFGGDGYIECGVCVRWAELGESCVDIANDPSELFCDAGLTCDATTARCVPFARAGEACGGDDGASCGRFVPCVDGRCPVPLPEGAGCDPGPAAGRSCDGARGLFCDPASRRCTARLPVERGGSCADFPCDYDLACVEDGGGRSGTCTAVIPVGGACGDDVDLCAFPAFCRGGVCASSPPPTCPAQ